MIKILETGDLQHSEVSQDERRVSAEQCEQS